MGLLERLTPNRARLPRLYAFIQCTNFVGALLYLGLNWHILGPSFVASDFGKYVFHLVYLPFAIYCLWAFHSILATRPDSRGFRGPILVLIGGTFGVFALLAVVEAKQAFEEPSLKTPPYPSDYWASFSEARVKGKDQTLGDVAINAYVDCKRDVKCYVGTLQKVGIAPSNRPPRYFVDVGPAGVVGPLLSAIAAGIAGTTLVSLLILIRVCWDIRGWADRARTNRISRDAGKMLLAVPAAAFALIAFIPLKLLSTVAIWAAEGPDTGVVVVAFVAACVALVVTAVAWFVVRNLRIAKKLAALFLVVVNLFLPIVKLVFPGSLKALETDLFPGAPWLGPATIALLLAFANVACLYVLLRLNDLPDDPNDKGPSK